jgi:hypothetical protein
MFEERSDESCRGVVSRHNLRPREWIAPRVFGTFAGAIVQGNGLDTGS